MDKLRGWKGQSNPFDISHYSICRHPNIWKTCKTRARSHPIVSRLSLSKNVLWFVDAKVICISHLYLTYCKETEMKCISWHCVSFIVLSKDGAKDL